jgi:hypothetical protein
MGRAPEAPHPNIQPPLILWGRVNVRSAINAKGIATKKCTGFRNAANKASAAFMPKGVARTMDLVAAVLARKYDEIEQLSQMSIGIIAFAEGIFPNTASLTKSRPKPAAYDDPHAMKNAT